MIRRFNSEESMRAMADELVRYKRAEGASGLTCQLGRKECKEQAEVVFMLKPSLAWVSCWPCCERYKQQRTRPGDYFHAFMLLEAWEPE